MPQSFTQPDLIDKPARQVGGVTMADGADATQGSTTNDSTYATIMGRLVWIREGIGDKTDPAWVSGAGSLVALLKGIFGKLPTLVSGRTPVDGSGVTQPVSAASLPLPTGAATETTLTTIKNRLPSTLSPSGNLGVAIQESLTLDVLTRDVGNFVDGWDATQGTTADTAADPTLMGRTQLIADKLNAGLPGALGSGGGLKVDGSGTPLPISGTVTVTAIALPLPTGAATETTLAALTTATGTQADAAYTTGSGSIIGLLKGLFGKLPTLVSGRTPVDGSGVTQPVSAASLPLPSGAATSAKQPALGTAGSSSADVIWVQGVPSGTPQPVSLASVPLPSGAATETTLAAINTTTGAQADSAWSSGAGSIIALLKAIAGKFPTLVSGRFPVDGSGVTQPVSAASLPLPSGAATETTVATLATQTTLAALNTATGAQADAAYTTGSGSIIALLKGLFGKLPTLVSGRLPVDGSGVTQPVSAATLPLPSGAATSAKQPSLGTAGTASTDVLTVQGISGGTPQPVSLSSVPLPTGAATETTLAALNTATGAQADAAYTTGSGSIIAILKGIFGKFPTLVSGRMPVDGSGVTQPVSAASLPLPSGAATAAKQPALGTAGVASTDVITVQGIASGTAQPISGNVGITGTVPLPTGAATETTLAALNTATGAQADAAYTTGSGSIIALLKGLFGKLPTLVSGRLPVDGSGVTQPVSAASLPLPTGAATETTLAALNTATGAQADAAYTTGSGSIIALLKGLFGKLPTALTTAGNLKVAPQEGTPDQSASGMISGTGGVVTLASLKSAASVSVELDGTWTGTVTLQYSLNAILAYVDLKAVPSTGGTPSAALTANGNYYAACGPCNGVQVYGTNITSGAVVVTIRVNSGGAVTQLAVPLPAGTNSIGGVTVADGADATQGASTNDSTYATIMGRLVWIRESIGDTTDPAWVSGAGSLVALLKGIFGKLPTLVGGRLPVDGSGVTQPVSGQVTTQSTTIGADFSAATANTPGTNAGITVTGLGPYRSAIFYLNVQGVTGGTLDIYLQWSPDSGTTWVDYAHFAQLAAGAAAIKRTFTITKSAQNTTVQTVGTNLTPALAAGTVLGGDWGDRLRVVFVTGLGTSAGTNQTIKAIFST